MPNEKNIGPQATEVTVQIRNVAFGGAGVGQVLSQSGDESDLLGITAFVPFTAKGEEVRARVDEKKKRFIKAELLEVLKPSPARREAPCVYFGDCGGCELQHIEYGEQISSKREMILGAMRAGQLSAESLSLLEDFVESDELHYRRRISLHVDSGGKVGFYREKTRSIVAIESCSIATNTINTLLENVQEFGAANRGRISSIQLEEDAHGSIAVLKSPYDLAKNELQSLLESARKHFKNVLVLVGEKEVGGFGRQILELPLNASERYFLKIPVGNFSQVNWKINLKLIEKTLEFAAAAQGDTIFDLYAGAGNFALPLARNGASVTAVESNPRLVAFSRENALKEGLSKRLFVEEKTVESFLNANSSKKVDTLVADPPRSGLGPLCSKLPKAKKLLLISCSLPSFVRDVRNLSENGWNVKRITPFDMFPQTSYVEILTLLERK